MPSTGLRSLRLVAAGRAVEAPAGDTRGPLLDRSSIVRVEVGYTDSPTHWDEQLSCLHRGTRLSHSSTLRITMARAPVLWSRRGPGWQGSVAFRRLPVLSHTVRAAVRTSVTCGFGSTWNLALYVASVSGGKQGMGWLPRASMLISTPAAIDKGDATPVPSPD